MNIEDKYEVTSKKRSEEFKRALDRIKRDFISADCYSDNPLFILAGGQPGSGKTALVNTIKSDNKNINFVTIDLDEFRRYHPDFEDIKKNHKQDGVLLTNSFAFEIENEMLAYVQENRINTINVSTLRNTKLIEQAIEENILPRGFKVKVYIIAVSPEESYFSTLTRYEEQQKDINCVTRFTSKEFHDMAYQGLNDTIKKIVQRNIPITVCKRASKKDGNPIIIYDEEKKIDLLMANSPIATIDQLRQHTGEKSGNKKGGEVFCGKSREDGFGR